jgi:hypothetical protein
VDAKFSQKDAQQQRCHPLLPAYAWNNAWIYRLIDNLCIYYLLWRAVFSGGIDWGWFFTVFPQ